MAKTQEELNALKNEVEALNKKLVELTEEELSKVNGGSFYERGHTWSDYPPHHLIVTMGYGCSLYEGPADRARCCFWCRHCFEDSFLGIVLYCDKRTYNNDPVDNIFNGIGQTSGRF